MKKKKPEKVWGFTVASFFALLAIYAFKYALDFLILPKLFPQFYPYSWGALIAWLLSTIIVTVAAMLWISRFGWFYPIANLVYVVLALIWPLGLYGMGDFWHPLVAVIVGGVAMDIIQQIILWIFIFVGFARM